MATKNWQPVAPGHNFFFGHLLYVKRMIDSLPPNAHYQYALGDIAREHFSKEGAYYLDLWPVSDLFLTVVSPQVATQIHANPHISMERPSLLPRFFKPICGGPSLFDLPEKEWKPWRVVFSKGFSADHNLSLVPVIVEETLVYCETLRMYALKGEMFSLDLVTLRFTIDVIGRTMLYVVVIASIVEQNLLVSRSASLGAQRGYNTLADCMLSQIRWHQANADTNPLQYLNLARRAVHWWNGRQMDKYIGNELDQRYNEYKADSGRKRTKTVIDLILQAYLPDNEQTRPEKLDAEFRTFAISQIRLFIFVGHDSTSSTICYILHLLASNPEALVQIRDEHDRILGADLLAVPSILKEHSHLTNQLPYTTAVITEALRLFPPAGCSRQGSCNVVLIDDEGNPCSTEHAAVFTPHTEMHRSPTYWNRPDDFLPERWLVESDDKLQPKKGAYRAFEIGPRNCIAQGYVLTELRVILACIVRQFDFQPAYEEWDRLHPSKEKRTYRGERAYQIEEGAAHPVEHYPCRVSVRG